MSNLAKSLFELSDKTALVTGGAVGLGRACATALAMAGADVAIVDTNKSVGPSTAEQIKSYGVSAAFFHCDVSDEHSVRSMMGQVIDRFGRLDIAVNNAGFGIAPGGAEVLDLRTWDRLLAVNLTGVFLCAQAEAQQMIDQAGEGGKIINIASIYGKIAGGNCGYNTAKAGVVQLTRTLASEWGRFNINVNSISPSWTMTPGMIETPQEVRTRMREVTPLGHLQRPEDIYGPIIFLASAASDFVTGHDLIVDGGHTVNTWLAPLVRDVPPRISPSQEDREAQHDIALMNKLAR